jgi:hypothetical protein
MNPTRVNPIGDLLEEKLEVILDSLAGDPIYEALSMGHPERMGISYGWTAERFIEGSAIRLPSGKLYQNFCASCDKFQEKVLIPPINRSRPL